MPIPRLHANGLGEVLGDQLVTTAPLHIAASVWFVHGPTGTDAVAPAGKERRKPLATLSRAVSNASAGDVIVLLDGHAETLTVRQTVSKRLTIVGSGQSSGKPTVKFTPNMASDSLFRVTAAGVELRNIWVEENAQANSVARIYVSASLFRLIGCYVECDGNDDANALELAVANGVHEVRNTTFVSTATDTSDVPEAAIFTVDSATRLIFDGVVFDGGTTGFLNGYAFQQDGGLATTQLIAENVSLLRGADMRVHENTIGWVIPSTHTGAPRIDWDGEGNA